MSTKEKATKKATMLEVSVTKPIHIETAKALSEDIFTSIVKAINENKLQISKTDKFDNLSFPGIAHAVMNPELRGTKKIYLLQRDNGDILFFRVPWGKGVEYRDQWHIKFDSKDQKLKMIQEPADPDWQYIPDNGVSDAEIQAIDTSTIAM
jgi:hypothetical protein